MQPDDLYELLRSVANGATPPAEALAVIGGPTFTDVRGLSGAVEARVDHDRARRCGFPEVIFCSGKTPEQVAAITSELLQRTDIVLGTRADTAHAEAVRAVAADAHWMESPRLIVIDRRSEPPREGHVVIASAGTADMPIAEEAAVTAEVMGCRVTRLYDVGIAGVHRALAHVETLRDARVVIAVAGMEGALPSLIAGLVDVPVVAVPTSVGYGANFGGVSALLTMLNSCAGGIGVVNIDNGFGAGVLASRINRPGWTAAEHVPDTATVTDASWTNTNGAGPTTTEETE